MKSYLIVWRESGWYTFFATKAKDIPQLGSEVGDLSRAKVENSHFGSSFWLTYINSGQSMVRKVGSKIFWAWLLVNWGHGSCRDKNWCLVIEDVFWRLRRCAGSIDSFYPFFYVTSYFDHFFVFSLMVVNKMFDV